MSRFSKMIIAALLVFAFAQSANAQVSYSYGPGYSWRLSPQGNIYLSRVYDRLLQTNWGFRAYRTRKECRPINIPELRAHCVASFDEYEPFIGRRGWY